MVAIHQPMFVGIITEGVAEKTFDTPDPEAAADTILYLMGSTRTLVAQLYAARDELSIERASRKLFARMTYLGTVVDRILGIPEGSIELADCQTMEEITKVWRAAAVA